VTHALTFDEARHEYRVHGEVVPSVTRILQATGVSLDFEALGGLRGTVAEAIARKRSLGGALHADIHAYDDRDLDWSSVHPDVRPYVEAWATFREHKTLEPIARERRLFHPSLRYAGTLDAILTGPDLPRPVIADVKTGDPEDAGARYQLAGYQLAYACEHPNALEFERWSVQLTPGRRVPYRVTPYTDWQDVATWQAIVATYYAQAARRRDPR
jgi:hypothetical protein